MHGPMRKIEGVSVFGCERQRHGRYVLRIFQNDGARRLAGAPIEFRVRTPYSRPCSIIQARTAGRALLLQYQRVRSTPYSSGPQQPNATSNTTEKNRTSKSDDAHRAIIRVTRPPLSTIKLNVDRQHGISTTYQWTVKAC